MQDTGRCFGSPGTRGPGKFSLVYNLLPIRLINRCPLESQTWSCTRCGTVCQVSESYPSPKFQTLSSLFAFDLPAVDDLFRFTSELWSFWILGKGRRGDVSLTRNAPRKHLLSLFSAPSHIATTHQEMTDPRHVPSQTPCVTTALGM